MIKKVFRKLGITSRALFSGLVWYFRDLMKYRVLLRKNNINSPFYFFPQIFDKAAESHTFDKHYVYMDRWAFKEILSVKPEEHVDVGSSIRFLSMVSAITKLKFVDIRPVRLDFDNFSCIEGSILKMPFPDNSLLSLSCLHVAEHIGLGRYGDPLDPLGTKKACAELSRVLAPGGRLYFAGPVGRQATYFNAHRVHSPQTILDYFSSLKLESFAAVDDQGHFMPEARIEDFANASYSCGCFIFRK